MTSADPWMTGPAEQGVGLPGHREGHIDCPSCLVAEVREGAAHDGGRRIGGTTQFPGAETLWA